MTEDYSEREILKIGSIDTYEQFTDRIGAIMRLLGIATQELRALSKDSVRAEKEYKRQRSTALLQCSTDKTLSNAELRKAKAELESLDAWEVMQITNFRRENCLEWIDTLKKALLAIQSIGATVRAEMQLTGMDTVKGRIDNKRLK